MFLQHNQIIPSVQNSADNRQQLLTVTESSVTNVRTK